MKSTTIYLQIEPEFGWTYDSTRGERRPNVRAVKVVGMTKNKPDRPRRNTITTKVTINVPESLFLSITPEVVINMPEDLAVISTPIEAEVADLEDDRDDSANAGPVDGSSS